MSLPFNESIFFSNHKKCLPKMAAMRQLTHTGKAHTGRHGIFEMFVMLHIIEPSLVHGSFLDGWRPLPHSSVTTCHLVPSPAA